MVGGSQEPDIESRIAIAEGKLEKTRFYLKIVGLWCVVSLIAFLAFGSILLIGLGQISRQAQIGIFVLAAVSLFTSLATLKWQRDQVFDSATAVRSLRLRRRIHVTPAGQAPNFRQVRRQYKAETWEYVEEARRNAASSRRLHHSFQVAIIVGSIAVTTLTSAMISSNPLDWIPAIVSALVSAAAGLSSYFKFRERSFNLQQTANSIEKEFNSVELRIHDYAKDANGSEEGDAAMQLFVERVEALKEEQRNRELQLEQSPEKTSSQSPPGTQAE